MKIPEKLEELINSGFWPNKDNVAKQNLEPIINFDLIKHLVPEEDTVYFYSPPFISIQKTIDHGDGFYLMPEVNQSLKQLNTEKTLIIGDFGFGSESELILDYSENSEEPKLLRLKWEYDFKNLTRTTKWVLVTNSFDEFATIAFRK